MSKAYILTDDDFEKLKLLVDQDPRGTMGYTDAGKDIYTAAHRYYNLKIHVWMDGVKK